MNLPIAVAAGTGASDLKLGLWRCGTTAVKGQSGVKAFRPLCKVEKLGG